MRDNLTFSLNSRVSQRIDVSPLTPDRLEGLSYGEICKLVLNVGNQELAVSEFFKISGSNTSSIRFENSSGLLESVGKGMIYGQIEVEGDAASYLGLGMRGGRIVVRGSVDAYAAAEIKDGSIAIEGNAGDFLAAARPGNKKGMSGGFVRVMGNVGDRAGDHMRRGIVLIEGDAGDYLGSRMAAGTMIVLENVGAGVGYGMNRGSLLLRKKPSGLHMTFADCGSHRLSILGVLVKYIEVDLGASVGLSQFFQRVRRYVGDQSVLGLGELLVDEDL